MIFEKSSASTFVKEAGQYLENPDLTDPELISRHGKPNSNMVIEPSTMPLMLKYHFNLGLLRNVAGYGREAIKDGIGAIKRLGNVQYDEIREHSESEV